MFINTCSHIFGRTLHFSKKVKISNLSALLCKEKFIDVELSYQIHTCTPRYEEEGKKKTKSDTSAPTEESDVSEKAYGRDIIRQKELGTTVNPDQDYPDRMRYRKLYHNPIDRTLGILKDDLIDFFGGGFKRFPLVSAFSKIPKKDRHLIDNEGKAQIFPDYCDVVIIGGGIVGASTAYHLAEKAQKGLRIIVVEKDLGYKVASTVHSVGGIRQQFSVPENIKLSQYGMEFLQNSRENLAVEGCDPPNVNVNFQGYLTLASEKGIDQLVNNYDIQRKHGAFVDILSVKQLQQKFPWINIDGVEAGVYGTKREGWFDPWALLLSTMRKAQSYGVEIVNGEATNFNCTMTGDLNNMSEDMKFNRMQRVNSVEVRLPGGETRNINCALCIVTAGPWSGELVKKMGIGAARADGILQHALPVEPRKRYVYCFESPDGPGLNCPLVVDTDGTYFRREGLGDLYLCGRSPTEEEEPDHSDLSVDDAFFEEKIWPVISKRCPSFEKLKVRSTWGGYYDYNTFDQNGIVGYHPQFSNMLLGSGFSGHGIQQAPGVGRALMELILYAEYKTIDLTEFGFERIIENNPLRETNIV